MKKLIFSAFFAFALIAAQVGTVFAQETTITGTVQSVTVETDETTGDTTVLVTYSYVDETGATQEQTARLSVATAEGLGLVTTTTTIDPATGETTTATTVNDGVVDTEVILDPATVIEDTTPEEESQHPVGSKLADFFSETLGVDYDTIMSYRDDEGGTAGFGIIAQALWMTTKMDGDTALFQTIVDAKLSGDYSGITLEDGSSPENWGQFKKAILKGESDNSVGDVMSGKHDPDEGETSTDQTGETLTGQNENGDQNGNSGNNNGNENSNKNKNKDKGNKGKGNK